MCCTLLEELKLNKSKSAKQIKVSQKTCALSRDRLRNSSLKHRSTDFRASLSVYDPILKKKKEIYVIVDNRSQCWSLLKSHPLLWRWHHAVGMLFVLFVVVVSDPFSNNFVFSIFELE